MRKQQILYSVAFLTGVFMKRSLLMMPFLFSFFTIDMSYGSQSEITDEEEEIRSVYRTAGEEQFNFSFEDEGDNNSETDEAGEKEQEKTITYDSLKSRNNSFRKRVQIHTPPSIYQSARQSLKYGFLNGNYVRETGNTALNHQDMIFCENAFREFTLSEYRNREIENNSDDEENPNNYMVWQGDLALRIAKEIDDSIFRRKNHKILEFFKVAGSTILGGTAANGLCGLIMYYTAGTFLNAEKALYNGYHAFEPESIASFITLAYLVTSLSPAIIKQFSGRVELILRTIPSKRRFKEVHYADGTQALILKKTGAYYLLKSAIAATGCATTLIAGLEFLKVEHKHPIFFGITVAPLCLQFLESFYSTGSRYIDNWFFRKQYSDLQNSKMRKKLKVWLDNSMQIVAKNDEYANHLYTKIMAEKDFDYDINDESIQKLPFLASLLFVRPTTAPNEDNSTPKPPNQNYKSTTNEKEFKKLSSAIMSATYLANIKLIQEATATVMLYFGIDPVVALYSSYAISAGFTTFWTYSQYDLQRTWFMNLISGFFASRQDYPHIRKFINGLSSVSSLLAAIPFVAATWEVYEKFDKPIQIAGACLALYSWFGAFHTYFFQHYNALIPDILNSFPESWHGMKAKKAILYDAADQVKNYIDQADNNVLKVLYQITRGETGTNL